MDQEELICLAPFLGEHIHPGQMRVIAHEVPVSDLRYADCSSFEITSAELLKLQSAVKHLEIPQSLAAHWTSKNAELVISVFTLEDRLAGVQIHKYRHLSYNALYETAPIRSEINYVRKILKFITDADEQ